VRDAVRDWGGHASVDSVGYLLVWDWHVYLLERLVSAIAADVIDADPDWRYTEFDRSEHWGWPLVSEEPAHLVPHGFDSWRAYKLRALNRVLERLGVTSPSELARQTWGSVRNTVQLHHPVAQALPALSFWLDMPAAQLPGHRFMPRVQSRTQGAAARFAVSPGDEANGYFHMPGGQSGHPLSPYYGAGHSDWETGQATPFLPGPAEATLTLLPDSTTTTSP
jgi:penicillin amidase